jgi:hypothetical protein
MHPPARLTTRRAVLARQLEALLETMRRQFGTRRVVRAVEFQGRARVIEMVPLMQRMRALVRVLREEGDSGIAPGPASGDQYDRVRRVLRRREQHEFELELGVPLSGKCEPWEEDRVSDDEREAPGRDEILADLRRPPAQGYSWEQLPSPPSWVEALPDWATPPPEVTTPPPPPNLAAPPPFLAAPPSEGVWRPPADAVPSLDEPCAEAAANREALGIDVFAFSEVARLRDLYCRHNFAALRRHELVRPGASCYDLIPELARLRHAAFEVRAPPRVPLSLSDTCRDGGRSSSPPTRPCARSSSRARRTTSGRRRTARRRRCTCPAAPRAGR